MATMASTSAERSAIRWSLHSVCALHASASCAPMVSVGLSAFMALCMTTEMSRQRCVRNSSGVSVVKSTPSKSTSPQAMRPG